MPPEAVRTFGKRRAACVSPVQAQASAGRDLARDALLRFAADQRESRAEPQPRSVPHSLRAALIAGLIVAFLHVGRGIEESNEIGQQLSFFAGEGRATSMLPLFILVSLWGGARATAYVLFLVHGLMRWLGRTRLIDYALGGGIVALAYAGAVASLGLGAPEEGWLFELVTGLAAGFLYRFFAGTLPR